MKLLRVQVPDFRILKNVDITFEPEFIPSIFPLGSQNGGGKSTLLQLIFILLHCSTDPEKKDFVKNILYGFTINNNSNKRVLAIIDIWNEDKIVQLQFLSYNDSYLRELLILNDKTEVDNDNYLQFSASSQLEKIINKISITEKEIQDLEKAITKLDSVIKIESSEDRRYILRELMDELRLFGFRTLKLMSRLGLTNTSIEEFKEEVQTRLDIFKLNLEKYYEQREQLKRILQRVLKYLQSENLLYICNYSANGNKDEDEVLLCRISNIDMNKVEIFMKELSQKIFLAAPSTQVFLFNSKESRKLLFKKQDNETDYYSHLKLAKSKLSGFFTYDFLAVDILIEAFKSARDKDFAEAIKKGEYGNSYKALINDLNIILSNKKINVDADLSGVSFKLDKDDLELYPEDLSHGELKRLSIYMWIKYHNIENAIVLMDEIEIAFHLDWQYQIIADINQWSPSNQYILATHSYELCQALTPAHVKELEPKLLKSEAKN
ncbi:MAG: AAA family ATPase [Nostoc sp.]|uniref:AAA family ATPase n=1 Tax=Nostoc sp. TaxID=1180 RepID=UPI002FF8A812